MPKYHFGLYITHALRNRKSICQYKQRNIMAPSLLDACRQLWRDAGTVSCAKLTKLVLCCRVSIHAQISLWLVYNTMLSGIKINMPIWTAEYNGPSLLDARRQLWRDAGTVSCAKLTKLVLRCRGRLRYTFPLFALFSVAALKNKKLLEHTF